MKIWKLLGLAALVTAAATVLLTTTTASAGGKEQSQTLVWWHNVTQGPGVKLYKDIAAEFQKQHPDVTIKAVAAAERAVQDQDPDRAAVGQPAGRVPELGRRRPRRPAEGRQGGRPDEVRQAVDQEHRRHRLRAGR